MNIKSIIRLLALFCFSCVFSQLKSVKVASENDSVSLAEVLIYSNDTVVGRTDKFGVITLWENYNSLRFVRENYQDLELSRKEIDNCNGLVLLKEIDFIQLENVTVYSGKETERSILNKISKARILQNQVEDRFYQSKVSITIGIDTLFFFNNIFSPKGGVLKVNDLNKVIYKGHVTRSSLNFNEYFVVNQKLLHIPISTSLYCTLGNHEITEIFNPKIYNYKLSCTDDAYILNFFPKKKSSGLLYEGYFIVDRFDFGILELVMKLSPKGKHLIQLSSFESDKSSWKYKIREDNFSFIFSRKDEMYFLESATRTFKCVQLEGSQLGQQIEGYFYNEQSVSHEMLRFKNYDFITHQFY